jgi:hypothetical protein
MVMIVAKKTLMQQMLCDRPHFGSPFTIRDDPDARLSIMKNRVRRTL